MSDIPWAAVIAACSALAGVLLTSVLASWRTKSDRLWELKRAAYGDIICRVRDILAALRSEPIADRGPKIDAAKEKLASAYRDNMLLTSPEFEAILFKASEAMAMNDFLEVGPSGQSALADVLGSAVPQMAAQAKRELGLEERRLFPKLKFADR